MNRELKVESITTIMEKLANWQTRGQQLYTITSLEKIS